MNNLYFDYNATTPLSEEVYEAMEPFFRQSFGNPSSFYTLGRTASRAIRQARKQVASLIRVRDANQILFTSGGTESNHAAIRGALDLSKRNEIILSTVEHPSVRKLIHDYANRGYQLHEIGVDKEGSLDIEALQSKLSEKTALVSLMWANNETGILFPVEEIGRLVKSFGAYFHVDAIQAAGKIPLNLENSSIDFLSLSAHKVYGPKGVGALYVKSGIKLPALFLGGSQEHGLRAGTENVPGIVGFGRAAQLADFFFDEESIRISKLRGFFEETLTQKCADLVIHGVKNDRLPNTSNIYFEGVDAETLLISLDQREMYASKGSACMSGAQQPSYVLQSMGCSDSEINGSIRVSFGRHTTPEQVEKLVNELCEITARLRTMERV